MVHIKKVLLAFAAFALLSLDGCTTTNDDSVRPWNAPQNWETGTPQGMMQGR